MNNNTAMNEQEIRDLFEHEPLANWNGTIMPISEVKVSVLDRAFLFGDAIYEVIRVYNGQPFLFNEHIQRLARNIKKLALDSSAESLAERVLQTLDASEVLDGVIYIQVTRGVAPRTHRYPSPATRPNELIYVAHFHDSYAPLRERGAEVICLPDTRWKRCDIKSVNLLANCMAAQTAYEAGCPDALFYDETGHLIEGTRTSLFAVRDGSVLTAPLGDHILPGITRKLVMELAEECDVKMSEETLHRDSLADIDELFLTGTTSEMLPVVKVDGVNIGTGTVGPVTQKLYAAYRARLESFAS